jgi:hypothetical protein
MSRTGRRIAVVGPEATGKTTLARALGERLGLAVLDDPRPELLARSGFHTLYEAARHRPIWRELLERQTEREARAGDAVVVDTPLLDCWVLWQRWGWCSATPAASERLYAAVVAAAGRYSDVVVMPSQQIAAGGHRFVDAENAAQIARLTRAAVDEVAGQARHLYLDAGDASAHLAAATALVRG